jgi:hypothetical protein
MGKPPKLRVIPAPPTERVNAPKWSRAEREYFAELHRIVDEVFSEAADTYDWTWSKLATHAELCYATVAKLGDRETKWPRYSTIYKLCKAVGIDLVLVKQKKQRKAPALKAG